MPCWPSYMYSKLCDELGLRCVALGVLAETEMIPKVELHRTSLLPHFTHAPSKERKNNTHYIPGITTHRWAPRTVLIDETNGLGVAWFTVASVIDIENYIVDARALTNNMSWCSGGSDS